MINIRVLVLVVAAVAASSTEFGGPRGLRAQAPEVEESASGQRAFVKQYCVGCHNERNKRAVRDFVLEGFDPARAASHPEIWEKVVTKMQAGLMPPARARRPEQAVYDGFVVSLVEQLDRAAAAAPDPGRTATFHRLNRTEYHHAIRDLLGLDIDVENLLPPDEAGGGNANFDNIAASLRVSESLLEQYIAVAERVSRTAVGGTPPVRKATFEVSGDIAQDRHISGLPPGTRGGVAFDYMFPVDAVYDFEIRLANSGPGALELSLDGERVKLFQSDELRGDGRRGRRRGGPTLNFRAPVHAGERRVVATFLKTDAAVVAEADRLPFAGRGELVAIDEVSVIGPYDVSGRGAAANRRRVFVCYPATAAAAEAEACARTIFESVARIAYRRPETAPNVDRLMSFYRQGHAESGFEGGVQLGLTALLSSPHFLLRTVMDPPDAEPGTVYRISDVELASRLSFFLWSSLPDPELLDAALQGRLSDPAERERQVYRMLSDPRAEALATNFAAQWLYLRNLAEAHPDDTLFADFDEALRQAFHRETVLFFDSVRRDNRSALDLMDGGYTFVNERLALHYGIPDISGDEFRRVALPPDSPRRGLLGKGSILTVTSRPHRTSPVLRGKWILENVFGTPPPDPPPNVPALSEDRQQGDGRVLTVREALARHRANPACSACHAMIDPPGFALESFDPVGRWRSLDENFEPLDTSGSLVDGTEFDGLAEFRDTIMRRPERFVGTLAEKLLIYALGRGLTAADNPAIRGVVRRAAADDYRFAAVVLGVVESAPFLMRKVAGEESVEVAVARR